MSRLKVTFNGSNANGQWNPAKPDSIVQLFRLAVPEGNIDYAIYTGKDDWTEVISAISLTYPTATTEVI